MSVRRRLPIGLLAGTIFLIQSVDIHAQAPGRVPVRPAMQLGVFGAATSEIGASVREVETADAERAKLSGRSGAVIDEVVENGPAATAGFRAGDVVVEFDGERVRSARQLARLVAETPAGRTVDAAVMRDGARIRAQVTPREGRGPMAAIAPDLRRRVEAFRDRRLAVPEVTSPRIEIDLFARPGRLGATIQDLTPQLAEFFGVKDGVLVTMVRENSPADQAGLQAGDVITALNGVFVENVPELQRRLASAQPGEELTLGIMRDKKELSLTLTLADNAPLRPRPIGGAG